MTHRYSARNFHLVHPSRKFCAVLSLVSSKRWIIFGPPFLRNSNCLRQKLLITESVASFGDFPANLSVRRIRKFEKHCVKPHVDATSEITSGHRYNSAMRRSVAFRMSPPLSPNPPLSRPSFATRSRSTQFGNSCGKVRGRESSRPFEFRSQ